MAKRLTDTNKFKKAFYRNLPGAYKLFYDFLYHDCDNAGIWIVDAVIAQQYLGEDMPININTALLLFNEDEIRIIEFDGGKKWFIPLFITFQYTKLSEKNRAHSTIIHILKKSNLIDDLLNPITISPKPLTSPLQAPYKPLTSPLRESKEKDNKNETNPGKTEALFEGLPPTPDNSLIGEMCLFWKNRFKTYTADKLNDADGMGKILAFMMRQSHSHDPTNNDFQIKCLNTLERVADEVEKDPFWINKPIKSIGNHIQEFYNKIKNPINGNGKSKHNGTKLDDEILKQKLAAKIEEWRQSSR